MKIILKRKKMRLNKWCIFIILIITLIFISSSYALWNTKLYINGEILGKKQIQMPVGLIPISGTDKYVEDVFQTNVATISEQYVKDNVLIINHKVHISTRNTSK